MPALLMLSGCFGGDEGETQHLIGPYYLDAAYPAEKAWYLHFDDEEFGLADALFNCQVVEVGYNETCVVMRAVCTDPQFYILPISGTDTREDARRAIQGPYTKRKFDQELKALCGEALPHFDAALTN